MPRSFATAPDEAAVSRISGAPKGARRIVAALAAGILLLGAAAAQHEHDHEAPAFDPDGLRAQLTRTTVVDFAGANYDISAVWATPALFAAEMPDAAEQWQAASSLVFLIDETSHSAELPDASPLDGAVLLVASEILLPERIEVTTPAEHHRLTILRFARSPYQDADVTLQLAGGQQLSWSPGSWFGLAADERIIEVTADDTGFSPSEMVVDAGVPLVFVFQNRSNREHHFHIMDLDPQDLRWFLLQQHDLELFDRALLETAERSTGHLCTSESGICRLGTNVHLHANPQQFDAVGFVAATPGSYLVVCPLHAEMRAEIVVR